MRGLRERVAAITGAGGDIGRAIAARLAEEGALVLATDIALEAAQKTARMVRDQGGLAECVAVDIRKPDEVDRIPAVARTAFGQPPEIVICNAGVQTFASVYDLTLEEWDRVLEVNARGAFLTMRMAAAVMRETSRGTIVAIASLQGRLGHAGDAHRVLEEAFARLDREDAMRRLADQDVLCAPVNEYPEVFADPQVLHNEMVLEAQHPTLGTVRLVGTPIKLSDTPGMLRSLPPTVGQHNEEILARLGYSTEAIAWMQAAGVVGSENVKERAGNPPAW